MCWKRPRDRQNDAERDRDDIAADFQTARAHLRLAVRDLDDVLDQVEARLRSEAEGQ